LSRRKRDPERLTIQCAKLRKNLLSS
jgi:hypothetical protein